MTEPDLFTYTPREIYPYAPATGKTDTSLAAAEVIRPKAATIRAQVLAEIKRGPGTYREIAARMGMDSRTTQPRMTELKRMGLIADTGERRDGCAVMGAAKP